jgi:hypothetical protein
VVARLRTRRMFPLPRSKGGSAGAPARLASAAVVGRDESLARETGRRWRASAARGAGGLLAEGTYGRFDSAFQVFLEGGGVDCGDCVTAIDAPPGQSGRVRGWSATTPPWGGAPSRATGQVTSAGVSP